MSDGVELLADRWAPREGGNGLPTALVRTPYGRRGFANESFARPLAERGFQVLMQSCRGTFGSGGTFDVFRHERADGLDTAAWLIEQPWFGGAIVLAGGSYLGYTQWAIADQVPSEVKAMVPVVTDSALLLGLLRKDAFAMETVISWGALVEVQERRGALLRQFLGARRLRRAYSTLPLNRADVTAVGRTSEHVQDFLNHDADDPYWAETDHRSRVAQVTVPVSSVAGWYDIFLPSQLRDYQALREAGRPARLTVGPWSHGTTTAVLGAGLRETLEFGLAHARGEQPPDRAPVRLYVMGEEAWRDVESWPPPGYSPRRFHLQPGGALSQEQAGDSAPDRYRYDPSDPTPAVGGVRLQGSGARTDNSAVEARKDVLTYTTTPLDRDVEIIGNVSAEIWFRSSLSHSDVFVRLCDVDDRGRSYNVCDGLISLSKADDLTCASVEMWPTAHRFKKGHRIRVQVASGAFPRYARNPGTGEPHATATTLRAADQEVYHDPARPSAVILPVREAD
ncbi:CocE/NonD family hydrolase [Streptomyces sp. NPDC057474]|uniref:CocE/NonD family hydrolase n=1 Tax=Streptomyces sp. NPDC057474 TaxID=3346144 RepID=UPI0036AC5738